MTKYFTVRDYFTRLQNRGNLLMLIPLLLFLVYYSEIVFQLRAMRLLLDEQEHIPFWIATVFVLALLFWLKTFREKRLHAFVGLIGLGKKMDYAGAIYLQQTYTLVALGTAINISLFIWDDMRFGILFLFVLVFYFWYRVTPSRFIRDLQLKGDERKMIETKGEAFR